MSVTFAAADALRLGVCLFERFDGVGVDQRSSWGWIGSFGMGFCALYDWYARELRNVDERGACVVVECRFTRTDSVQNMGAGFYLAACCNCAADGSSSMQSEFRVIV